MIFNVLMGMKEIARAEREIFKKNNPKGFLDDLIVNPMDLRTEYAEAVVEREISEVFDGLGSRDRRVYSKLLRDAGYSAGCILDD